MRFLSFLVSFFLISSCTTLEVTKEVVKVTSQVKKNVERKIDEKNIKQIENKTIIEEKKIISEKEKEEKIIVATQQKLANINFIGIKINKIEEQLGVSHLARSDGSTYTLRYDSESCRLFLFFKLESNNKRVEYFEFRDKFGKLLNSKQSLENCYREYKLI